MLADMLAEIMLESNAPEEIKLGVRIVQQGKKVSKAAHEIVEAFAGDPATVKASDTETLKQVLEYLGLVEVGLKQFMETTQTMHRMKFNVIKEFKNYVPEHCNQGINRRG